MAGQHPEAAKSILRWLLAVNVESGDKIADDILQTGCASSEGRLVHMGRCLHKDNASLFRACHRVI